MRALLGPIVAVAIAVTAAACEQDAHDAPAPAPKSAPGLAAPPPGQPAPTVTSHTVAPAPPPPPPAAPPGPRPHTLARGATKLDTPLPRHGVAFHEYGLGGDDLVVIDTDANTVRYAMHPMFRDRKPTDKTRPLTAAERARFVALADAAWREAPVGHTPDVTDVGSYLEIGDGDDVFYATGTLFEAPWRPAAGLLVAAIGQATWMREPR